MFPSLDSIREELLNSFAGCSDEELNQKPSADSWSISEVLQHLYIIEKVIVGIVESALQTEDNIVAELPIQMVLNRSVKVKAPESLNPSRENVSRAELLRELEESRHAVHELLDKTYQEELYLRKSAKHPVIGAMNLKQWIEIIALHEKRHIEQIEEIKAELQIG